MQVFKCIVGKCGEMFTDLESFLGHAKSHENNMMYRCPHCPKTLPSLYDLNIHQLTHTLCVTSDNSSISVTIGSNGSSGRKPHARWGSTSSDALSRSDALEVAAFVHTVSKLLFWTRVSQLPPNGAHFYEV